MFIQINDILLLSDILCSTINQYLKLPPETALTTRNWEMIKLTESRTEKSRGEIIFNVWISEKDKKQLRYP